MIVKNHAIHGHAASLAAVPAYIWDGIWPTLASARVDCVCNLRRWSCLFVACTENHTDCKSHSQLQCLWINRFHTGNTRYCEVNIDQQDKDTHHQRHLTAARSYSDSQCSDNSFPPFHVQSHWSKYTQTDCHTFANQWWNLQIISLERQSVQWYLKSIVRPSIRLIGSNAKRREERFETSSPSKGG